MNIANVFFLFLVLLIMTSCNYHHNTKGTSTIERSKFGILPNGKEADLYTLKNENNITIAITNYGGIIVSALVPDINGELSDIVLGYDKVEDYVKNNPYFGAIIGRYGNRIEKGKFTLDNKEYQLATNNGVNHLHGGVKGFDKVIWEAKTDDKAEPSLILSYTSKDNEEGYPGNLHCVVKYTLTNNNELIIDYEATTDKPTIVNMCNHSYFNLSGGKTDILSHRLEINADSFCGVDNTLIPLPLLQSVDGTVFDFRRGRIIGTGINDTTDIQIRNGGGYDHCWVLNKNNNEKYSTAAALTDSLSGRTITVLTTEPGIQFYSGNFLDGTITGKYGNVYGYRSGLCLETQHFPNSPNRKDFPSTTLLPGEKYISTTIYRFSAQ